MSALRWERDYRHSAEHSFMTKLYIDGRLHGWIEPRRRVDSATLQNVFEWTPWWWDSACVLHSYEGTFSELEEAQAYLAAVVRISN